MTPDLALDAICCARAVIRPGDSPRHAGEGLPVNPLRKMFIALFKSRSIMSPHSGHIWVRTPNALFTYAPHLEQICDVSLGSTEMNLRPASIALSSILLLRIPNDASS